MKTIKTPTHLLLVDETADLGINKPFYGYCWNWRDKVHYFNTGLNKDARGRNGIQKIIAASPKLDGIPEFETLPPSTEDDVEKTIMNKWVGRLSKMGFKPDEIDKITEKHSFHYIDGYKQAKSETMFSLEDIENIWNKFVKEEPPINNGASSDFLVYLKQSLSKQKEYEFVPEMESVYAEPYSGDESDFTIEQPKIVNNKIQGTWKILH